MSEKDHVTIAGITIYASRVQCPDCGAVLKIHAEKVDMGEPKVLPLSPPAGRAGKADEPED